MNELRTWIVAITGPPELEIKHPFAFWKILETNTIEDTHTWHRCGNILNYATWTHQAKAVMSNWMVRR